jgi:hypothetical protein
MVSVMVTVFVFGVGFGVDFGVGFGVGFGVATTLGVGEQIDSTQRSAASADLGMLAI